MGVGIEPVGTATRARQGLRTRGAAALGLLAVASVVLSVVGIGTGDGPLGPSAGYGVAVSRDVGDEVTEGNTLLTNDGWFMAHIESIRPVPVDAADNGLRVAAVELVPTSAPGIGTVDGAGYDAAPREMRSLPTGYAIPSRRRVGSSGDGAEVLVRLKVERKGAWRYRGYEVVYRSGFVRYRMFVEAQVLACTPSGGACLTGPH